MKNLKLKNLLVLMTVALIATLTAFPIKASAAWKQSDSGNWNYTEGDTSVSGWKSIDGNWYFFDSNGSLKTGWILDGSTWYYTAPSGEMKTGWINDGGKWYYTASSGAMQTGWLSNNGAWYYLSTSGDMKTGLVDLNNKTYYLSESGAMKTGNVTVNGVNYTFAANGEKLNPATTKPTTTDSTASATSSSTSSSGSSGGSSSSSSSSSSYYKSLYGTWTVKSCISSTSTTLTPDQISLGLELQFTITQNSISATIPSLLTRTFTPTVKESTMTASAFNNQWNVKLASTTVKCINISYNGYSGYIYITDNGTYAAAKGSLFEIEQ